MHKKQQSVGMSSNNSLASLVNSNDSVERVMVRAQATEVQADLPPPAPLNMPMIQGFNSDRKKNHMMQQRRFFSKRNLVTESIEAKGSHPNLLTTNTTDQSILLTRQLDVPKTYNSQIISNRARKINPRKQVNL